MLTMVENNTSEYIGVYNATADNDTVEDKQRFYEIIGDRWMAVIAWFLLVLTLTAFVYGVTSWYMIKRFRHFGNYVILSAITARMLMLLFYLSEESIQNLVLHVLIVAVIMYCTHSYHCWLLVLCYIFYVSFVKVFHLNIRRIYLKSSLFGWGAPFIVNVLLIIPPLFLLVYGSNQIITHQIVTIIFILLTLLPVAISLGLYIKVLLCLFNTEADASLHLTKWRRFYIATLICVLSNVVVLTALLDLLGIRILVIDAIGDILGEFLNTIVLVVYFVTLKSNRKIWCDFLSKSSRENSLEMNSAYVSDSHGPTLMIN